MIKKIVIIISTLLILLVVGIVKAADENCSMNDQLASNDVFISKIKSWRNGVPSVIGLQTRNLSPDNFINSGDGPELSALCLIEHYSNVFKLNDPKRELTTVNVKSDDLGYTHIFFNRIFQNIPVWNSELIVHFNAEGRVTYINGAYHPSFNISIQPKLTADEAIEIARKDNEFIPENINTDLVIYPKDESYLLSWSVHSGTLYQAGVEYIVDASTGEILHKFSGIYDENNVPSPLVQEESKNDATTDKKVEPKADNVVDTTKKADTSTNLFRYRYVILVSILIVIVFSFVWYKYARK